MALNGKPTGDEDGPAPQPPRVPIVRPTTFSPIQSLIALAMLCFTVLAVIALCAWGVGNVR